MHKQSHQNTHPTFTYRKGRIFYFRRKIPSDLRCHYKRPVFVQSLRTTSRSSAQKAATILSARLDEQWLHRGAALAQRAFFQNYVASEFHFNYLTIGHLSHKLIYSGAVTPDRL